ncbi:MAG: GNAT family N-acetyltransferase [Steroidobacter sp.]
MIPRKPTIADAPLIASLSDELGYAVDSMVMAKRLMNLIDHPDCHLVLVESDGEVAGWIQVHAYESLESGFRTEIVGLVVGSRFRRKGIGRLLVDDAIKWSKMQGAEAVVVRSNVVRKESHQFYPSVGFKPMKTQAVYRKLLR